ncbi:transcription termination factor MTEF18, mitochondrial-like [Cornus florida]|uniref:transcription termination factor MTEF18, mitochondrial-like n=1 Tax=Cornus florida TaxID=4283 RepID=UPI0028A113B5|nr:transcription termination factor MTEF18, mitochondrial-like [Cornus florida]XP_059659652.1 transcription termination factor MTEF18, mitochondrial-like [Cornus florida]XP_059659653.1 transcription termination factor MTEF18, mitochondrial-like [Cornus florida]XP_059659654.1 transcription termination factor MTEF18, mitochondrial-like [Cornus florida]
MTHLLKPKRHCVLKWVSLNLYENKFRSSKTSMWAIGSHHIAQNPRYFGTKRVVGEAQAALLEYLHSTRSLQYMDADNMSRNSPLFLEKLLKKVENEVDVGWSITRLLRYNPINEFEPFFESIGLKPSEYSTLLPRALIFLNDDQALLKNFRVLCDYGIARNKIGKIYKEATEVFRYDDGVLQSKLQAFEEMGLNQSTIIKIVSSSPYLLVRDANRELPKILEKLKCVGIEYGCIEGHLLEGNSYNWSHMFELLCLLSNMGCSEEQLKGIICQHPGLLFQNSGNMSFSLIGFLMKFGATRNEICSIFLQFPQAQVGDFVCNLRHCYHFLINIEMEVEEIGRIVRSHPVLLGSCYLKKLNTLLSDLKSGKKRLREIIKKNPQELKNWVFGSRVKPLPNSGDELRSRMMRIKFLLDLGFVEDSNEMRKSLKVFRGKGGELQERFDCFVNAGLNKKDVTHMIKVAPQILNLKKEVIKMKIDFLVNDSGYPLSTLITFPAYVGYTNQRVKLRLSMYNWLKDKGTVELNLALSTVISSTEKIFMRYVKRHPRGPEVWQMLKTQISSD